MNDSNIRYLLFVLLFVVSFADCLFALPCRALEPSEILVLANRNAARSVGLAKYYMRKRKIPPENLIQLWVTDKETCSRSDYEKKVAAPVRRHLEQKAAKWRIRCLVIMYGLPLKVSPPDLTAAEQKRLADLKQRQKALTVQLLSPKNIAVKNQTQLKSELENINKKISSFKKSTDKGASLDSEIALVLKKEYPSIVCRTRHIPAFDYHQLCCAGCLSDQHQGKLHFLADRGCLFQLRRRLWGGFDPFYGCPRAHPFSKGTQAASGHLNCAGHRRHYFTCLFRLQRDGLIFSGSEIQRSEAHRFEK